MSDEGNPEDALPIKKTSSTAYIVGGVGVLIILGLVFGLSGGDEETAKAKAEKTEQDADAAQGMTKAEAEERAAHLKKTQAALAAAAAEEAGEEQQKKAAEDAKKAEAQAAAAPAAPASGSKPKSAPKPKVDKSSLDGLGSDITSALE